jgi:hypothetical protein
VTHPTLASGRGEFGGRVYRIPGRKDKYGKQLQYPSVTTVLGMIDKPGISQWIADETAAYAVANLMYLEQHTEEYGWRYLRHYWHRTPDLQASELRLHHEGVKNDAAELGTNIHEWIEAELGLRGQDVPGGAALEVEQMIDAFDRWAVRHDIEPRWAERTVVHDELGYAGTGDAHWYMRCTHADPCLPDGRAGTSADRPEEQPVHLARARRAARRAGERAGADHAAGPSGHARARGSTRRPNRDTPRVLVGRRAAVKIRSRRSPAHQAERPGCAGRKIPAYCELEDRTEDLDIYWGSSKGALATPTPHTACASASRPGRRSTSTTTTNWRALVANSITYTGRIINTRPEHIVFGKSRNGVPVLKLTLAEQHQGRNDRVPEKFRHNDKATDAWVNTTTTWHKLTLMGDIAADVASDERFSHGTLVTVSDASYEEEDPWTTRDGVQRRRPPRDDR